ncbi:MAG: isocitrate lyase/PEP mutase family protein [Acidimicrobiales bacterium]
MEAAQAEQRGLLLPGAVDAATARLVEELGFGAVYLTGAGFANAHLGYPDLGLVTLTELVDHVAATAETVRIPLVVDADTGFGNPLNVQRTVRLLEQAGAAAIQLEDQVTPKRCGHFDGKEVISRQEMVRKIEAAVDARRGDTLVIARTDARAVTGLDDAIRRAASYRDAGADILFVEAPTTRDELARIPAEVPGPHVVNMVEGGKTPLYGIDELAALGFTVILYANTAFRAALFGARAALRELRDTGGSTGVVDRMITWDERQDLVRKDELDAAEARYQEGEAEES